MTQVLAPGSCLWTLSSIVPAGHMSTGNAHWGPAPSPPLAEGDDGEARAVQSLRPAITAGALGSAGRHGSWPWAQSTRGACGSARFQSSWSWSAHSSPSRSTEVDPAAAGASPRLLQAPLPTLSWGSQVLCPGAQGHSAGPHESPLHVLCIGSVASRLCDLSRSLHL